jgi:organic radical activating enzyme
MILNVSKSCNLKGQQKLFYLFLEQTSSCCRAYPESLDAHKNLNDYLDQWQHEKQQLDQGIELTNCNVCWKHEKAGEVSHRLRADTDSSDFIELAFSNACNHMCSYCSPKFSSTWQDSIQTHGMFDNISQTSKHNLQVIKPLTKHTDYWVGQLKDYIDRMPDNSVSLRLLGGEPLMQIANLQNLFEFQNKKIKAIKITTNLNPPDNKFLLWLLKNVDTEKVEINISLDASPSYNHVPRWGFDQEKFQNNLQLLIDHNVKFEFMAVMSVLGVFDIANYTQWIQQHNYKINFFPINQPDCLDANLVPLQFLQPILLEFGKEPPPEIFSKLFKMDQPEVGLKLFEQYNYLIQYFSRTGIEVEKINNQFFQDYWHWLCDKVKK